MKNEIITFKQDKCYDQRREQRKKRLKIYVCVVYTYRQHSIEHSYISMSVWCHSMST